MSKMTPERLTELRMIAEAATPGPWTHLDQTGEPTYNVKNTSERLQRLVSSTVGGYYNDRARDAAYIATFDPPTVLSLLDRIEVLEAKEPATLNELAAECHRLAVARGKYPEPWRFDRGIHDVIGELLELLAAYYVEVCNGPTDWGKQRIDEEAGDSLHGLLSVMAQAGIDVEQALRDAMKRNAERAGEGV